MPVDICTNEDTSFNGKRIPVSIVEMLAEHFGNSEAEKIFDHPKIPQFWKDSVIPPPKKYVFDCD
jgi:hypothetical protein